MALIKDPQARARAATTELQAARLKEELEVELALNDKLPAGWEEQADAALAILRERWSDLDSYDSSDLGGNGNWQPSYSAGAKTGLARRHADPSDREAIEREHSSAQRGDSAAAARLHARGRPHIAAARRRGRGRILSPRARRAVRTATPGAVTDWTTLALQALGGGFALSIAYLLLSREENPGKSGIRPVSTLLGAFAVGFSRFFSPKADLLPASASGLQIPDAATLQAKGAANIAAGKLPLAGVPGYGPTGQIPYFGPPKRSPTP